MSTSIWFSLRNGGGSSYYCTTKFAFRRTSATFPLLKIITSQTGKVTKYEFDKMVRQNGLVKREHCLGSRGGYTFHSVTAPRLPYTTGQLKIASKAIDTSVVCWLFGTIGTKTKQILLKTSIIFKMLQLPPLINHQSWSKAYHKSNPIPHTKQIPDM